MRIIALLVTVALLAAAAPALAATTTVTKSYDLAAPPLVRPTWDEPVNLGLLVFDPSGLDPVEVTVDDASGAPVEFMVSQDYDGDRSSDVVRTGCGTTLDLSSVPLLNNRPVHVWVETAGALDVWTGVNCPTAVATTGTVTLTLASP